MRISTVFLLPLVLVTTLPALAEDPHPAGYRALLKLFEQWRAFEHPPLLDGAPDYTATTFENRQPAFRAMPRKSY